MGGGEGSAGVGTAGVDHAELGPNCDAATVAAAAAGDSGCARWEFSNCCISVVMRLIRVDFMGTARSGSASASACCCGRCCQAICRAEQMSSNASTLKC